MQIRWNDDSLGEGGRYSHTDSLLSRPREEIKHRCQVIFNKALHGSHLMEN